MVLTSKMRRKMGCLPWMKIQRIISSGLIAILSKLTDSELSNGEASTCTSPPPPPRIPIYFLGSRMDSVLQKWTQEKTGDCVHLLNWNERWVTRCQPTSYYSIMKNGGGNQLLYNYTETINVMVCREINPEKDISCCDLESQNSIPGDHIVSTNVKNIEADVFN